MTFSLAKSIFPMSELRSDPEKIKKQLKQSPVVITNNGRPDFGICDLATLEIAIKVKELHDTLIKRKTDGKKMLDAEEVFDALDKKYGF